MAMLDIVGRNRSGALFAPVMTLELIAATEEFPPSSEGDARAVAAVRVAYAKSGGPAASMPPPTGVTQLAKKAIGALFGTPDILLDKLGERLAYERSGVRLYEALLSKLDAYGSFRGGPSRKEVQHILDEEMQHFTMLAEAIARHGGDPTAVTPSANVQAVASKGICAVLADPRMNLLQSLEVMQIVELADNDCWTALLELAAGAGDQQAAAGFSEALEHEREHLTMVREWVAAGQGRATDAVAGAEPAPVRRSAPSKRRKAPGTSRSGAAKPRRSAATAARSQTKRATGARKTTKAAAKNSAARQSKSGGKPVKRRAARS